MPRSSRSTGVLLAGCCLGLLLSSGAHGARIEAKPGKRYTVTQQNGPWMVMVATFHPSDGAADEGKTPEQAADALVLELRQNGIPAYVFEVNPAPQRITAYDAAGRPVQRKPLRRAKSIGVLAGNYPSVDDATAQRTRDWIKRYDPKCLKEGVAFRETEHRPTPLASAFLVINPLLDPEDVMNARLDPLLLRLNHRERYSLLENKGKHTVVVATFAGKVKTVSGRTDDLDAISGNSLTNFLKDNDLDDAAQQARDLCVALRDLERVEAYVWHDRYESCVTVGSFSSPSDPGVAALKARFGNTPTTATPQAGGIKTTHGGLKYLAVDASGQRVDTENPPPGGFASDCRIWAFDPNPHAIRVPGVR